MINILCFGDSNTNGSNPSGGRWPIEVRWTGLLQKMLGEGYHIYEEGLGGRTTIMDDPLELNKNGRSHLEVSLRTHRPLDLVIIMLGTNDMKFRHHLLARDISEGVEALGKLVERYDYGGPWYPIPKVLLVSPILLGEGVENSVFGGFTADAVELSKQLAPYYKKVAERNAWAFFDAASVASPSSKDFLHMEADSHYALAVALTEKLREIFEKK